MSNGSRAAHSSILSGEMDTLRCSSVISDTSYLRGTDIGVLPYVGPVDSTLQAGCAKSEQRNNRTREMISISRVTLAPNTKDRGMNLYEAAYGFISDDGGTKSLSCYADYDSYLRRNDITPKAILEVGVYKGESAKVFAKCFPDAKIVGVDLAKRDIDFSEFQNIRYLQCDQTDRHRLESIIKEEFPEGIDLITEDASHIGALSALTFEICFPFLRSGGAYVIEDWGTGYWDDWPDGGRFQEYALAFYDGHPPKRIPSHDFGMVGFVKSLVDWTNELDIKPTAHDKSHRHSRIRSLEFSDGMCFALKA